MTQEIVLLVLGAILGALITPGFQLVRRHVTSFRGTRHRVRRLERDSRVVPAALEWFREQGLEDALWRPTHLNDGRPIPFLRDPGPPVAGVVGLREDDHVWLPSVALHELEVDDKLIAARRRAGAQLWDGPLMYVADIESAPDGSRRLVARVCNYFSYVTQAERIQRSLLARDSSRGQVHRDKRLTAFPSPGEAPYRPMALSAVTTCAFDMEQGRQLLLATRAHGTVNAMGTVGAIPTFGFEPHEIDGMRSKYSAIFYNFVKEFLEEIYGQEELTRAATSESLDPDAIFQSRTARRLISEFEQGRAELRLLGCGVDVTDGGFVLALVAHFRSPEFYAYLRGSAKAGWEVERVDTERPLRFAPASAAGVIDAVSNRSMSSSSIFGVDLALSHLSG